MEIFTREEAMELLRRYTKSAHLIRHAIAVEAAMRQFSKKLGENKEKWGIIGLLHDVDYELYPEEHCIKCRDLLLAEGLPLDWIRSIQSHGWQVIPGVEEKPIERMEWVLYTVDQLTGLISATTLVRPSKSLTDLESKSVRKKWKDKSFAANVDRSVIQRGLDALGMELNEAITETIAGMRIMADALELNGPRQ